jgi:hypothetical protein
MNLAERFAQNYIRLSLEAALSDIIVVVIQLGNATPEDFDKAIQTGWSIVDMALQMPQQELMTFQKIPSVNGLRKFAPLLLGGDNSTVIRVLESLVLSEIADGVAKELPQHAEVLRKNLPWLQQELAKLKDLFVLLVMKSS